MIRLWFCGSSVFLCYWPGDQAVCFTSRERQALRSAFQTTLCLSLTANSTLVVLVGVFILFSKSSFSFYTATRHLYPFAVLLWIKSTLLHRRENCLIVYRARRRCGFKSKNSFTWRDSRNVSLLMNNDYVLFILVFLRCKFTGIRNIPLVWEIDACFSTLCFDLELRDTCTCTMIKIENMGVGKRLNVSIVFKLDVHVQQVFNFAQLG